MSDRRLRVAVLASGSGTTFENLVRRSRDGRLSADVVALAVSRPDSFAKVRAERLGVPCTVLGSTKDPAALGDEVGRLLEASGAGLCAMAGFVRLWRIPAAWHGRVMNVHPALLPAFGGRGMYGHRVHEAAIAAGVKVSGCTVHFCDDEYDHGPIVLQRAVPVLDDDTPETLGARVQEAEREAYPAAIALFAEGRLQVEGRRVRTLS